MPKVLIVVEASEDNVADSPTMIGMVSALKRAIATSGAVPVSVEVVEAKTLRQMYGVDLELESNLAQDWATEDVIVCPLTLDLPHTLPFGAQTVYQACRDVYGLRQRLAQKLGCAIAQGCFWLPLVLTTKGPLYGEVIGVAGTTTGEMPEHLSPACGLNYYQPFHLSDALRQQLYRMGQCLLQLLSAPPAVYLLQFGFQGADICFDRLWPFPAAPAIASLGVQEPDLFACHWYCLASLPLLDLTIIPPVTHKASS